ncbi:aa3-type cytochrome c oxidase subunit IV [Oceaniglobus indicus]|nr:aa3-type cytochrome c oxidase subunit IV [Oceaniglobus indicus]
MADHKHGTMDVEEHEKTFEGFVKFAFRSVVVVIVTLILLALVNG